MKMCMIITLDIFELHIYSNLFFFLEIIINSDDDDDDNYSK